MAVKRSGEFAEEAFQFGTGVRVAGLGGGGDAGLQDPAGVFGPGVADE